MRKASIQLLGLLLLLLIITTSWGKVALSVAQPSSAQKAFLPLVMKPRDDLTVSEVKVIQGTSLSDSYLISIADRETLVRVFVGTSNGDPVSEVTGRLCGYNAGGLSLGCMYADNGTITPPSQEEVLDSTLNFKLPMAWVKPGYAYHVDVDPVDLNPNNATAAVRFPSTDKQPFNFVPVSKLEVTVVPIEYRPYQSSQSFLPKTDDISYLTELPVKVFPVSKINYHNHANFTYTPTSAEENLDQILGWINLLADLTAVHAMEDPTGIKNYYGLVNVFGAHGCDGGCITGIGWLGGTGKNKTAAGWSGSDADRQAASETMVHEIGHNFNRKHVVCTGSEDNPDLDYPYANGAIGQFGLDVIKGTLFQPDSYYDFMSYCDPTWTSDYTYWNIYQYRKDTLTSAALASEVGKAYYVSGVISPDGEITLRPVYSQTTRVPVYGMGSHTLDLLDYSGRTVASYLFNPVEIADSGGYRGFSLFVPLESDLGGLRVLQGTKVLVEKIDLNKLVTRDMNQASVAVDRIGDQMHLRWSAPIEQDVVYRIRLSKDGGKIWQVLALNWSRREFLLPAGLNDGLLEIQSSDGLPISTTIVNLPGSRSGSGTN